MPCLGRSWARLSQGTAHGSPLVQLSKVEQRPSAAFENPPIRLKTPRNLGQHLGPTPFFPCLDHVEGPAASSSVEHTLCLITRAAKLPAKSQLSLEALGACWMAGRQLARQGDRAVLAAPLGVAYYLAIARSPPRPVVSVWLFLGLPPADGPSFRSYCIHEPP